MKPIDPNNSPSMSATAQTVDQCHVERVIADQLPKALRKAAKDLPEAILPLANGGVIKASEISGITNPAVIASGTLVSGVSGGSSVWDGTSCGSSSLPDAWYRDSAKDLDGVYRFFFEEMTEFAQSRQGECALPMALEALREMAATLRKNGLPLPGEEHEPAQKNLTVASAERPASQIVTNDYNDPARKRP